MSETSSAGGRSAAAGLPASRFDRVPTVEKHYQMEEQHGYQHQIAEAINP